MKRIGVFLAMALALAACNTQDGLTPKPQAIPPGDPVLSPIEMLKPDTAEAALTDSALFGVPQIGVWSAEPGGCKLIDTAADFQSFAVVTAKTMRLGKTTCAIAPKDGGGPVDALCGEAGATQPRTFTFAMDGGDSLTIAEPATKAQTRYVRCRLP